MHAIDSFCVLDSQKSCENYEVEPGDNVLEAPVDAPMAFEPKSSVVDLPAFLKPEDAVSTASGVEWKGKIVPLEDPRETFASPEAVEKLKSEETGGSDSGGSGIKLKDVGETAEKDNEDGLFKRPVNPAIAKTSLCSYFRKRGCKHGENCKFAHGESELQQRPDGTWDPTSERCKKKEDKADNEEKSSDDSQYRKCLVNLPMNWSQQKFKSFLDEKGITYSSAQKRKSMKVGFLGFHNQEELTKSAEILDGMPVANKRLKLADVLPREWERKAIGVTDSALAGDKEEKDNDGEDTAMTEDRSEDDNERKEDENENEVLEPYRNVTQVVTPLAHLSYEDQLSKKTEEIVQVLKRLARNIRKGLPNGMLLPDWLAAAKDREGLPCEFEGILPSPVVDGYRNKCEFAIGLGPDGKQRVVGFQLGSFREGIIAIAEPGNCRNVSSVALSFVAALQKFIRASKLPVWNKKDNTGFWRMLTIREGREPGSADEIGKEIAEVMLVVQVIS